MLQANRRHNKNRCRRKERVVVDYCMTNTPAGVRAQTNTTSGLLGPVSVGGDGEREKPGDSGE